ncbi:hypothetical protein FHX60_000780 [Cupriavidus alkaliphilus]|nr:hypothetical protein [Cupriavidus alkaliphilus]
MAAMTTVRARAGDLNIIDNSRDSAKRRKTDWM